MNKLIIIGAGFVLFGTAAAENVQDSNEMICAAGQAQICLESGECYSAVPWELSIPDFVVIDLKEKTVRTTEASGENRETEFSKVEKSGGKIHMQGIDGGRAFSFVIDELTGRLTAAIARDGLSVTIFGACSDTDI